MLPGLFGALALGWIFKNEQGRAFILLMLLLAAAYRFWLCSSKCVCFTNGLMIVVLRIILAWLVLFYIPICEISF